MYLYGTRRSTLGQDDDDASWTTTPVASIGLSPLWMLGLGLFAAAYLVSGTRKVVGGLQRRSRVKARRRLRIIAARAELKAAKAS